VEWGNSTVIELTIDYGFINYVANHPKVHPTAFPNREDEWEDLSTFPKGTIFLRWKDFGVFTLVPMQSNEFHYTVHTMFLPETPSKEVVQAALEGFYFTFIALDADKLYTSACTSNIPALRLSRAVGWKEDFKRPSHIKKGKEEHFFSLSAQEWVLSQETFSPLGEQFHKLVEDTTNHEDDPIHDKIVGATIAMFQCGNAEKAVCFYNEWAERAYYVPMEYSKEGIITLGDMTIQLNETQTEILRVV